MSSVLEAPVRLDGVALSTLVFGRTEDDDDSETRPHDGRTLASASGDNRLRLWDARTHREFVGRPGCLPHRSPCVWSSLRCLERYHLLVVDEIGYLPLERPSANLLFARVARRCERGSIVVTSNRGLEAWGETLAKPLRRRTGDGMMTTAASSVEHRLDRWSGRSCSATSGVADDHSCSTYSDDVRPRYDP
jgi:hypothetical protein